jgi:YD repeat-containing protein
MKGKIYLYQPPIFPVRVKFYYNSGSTYNGRAGRGWKFCYDLRYIRNNFNDDIIIVMPDDRAQLYKYDTTKSFYYSPGLTHDSLIETGNGFILSVKNDSLLGNGFDAFYHFEAENHHYLTKISNYAGQEINFEYDNEKKLKRINFFDTYFLVFSYNDDKISEILLSENYSFRYYFESDFFTGVEYPDGGMISYSYDDCNRLSLFSDKKFKNFEISYDDNCRIKKIDTPEDGFYYELHYLENESRIENADGETAKFIYDTNFRIVQYIDYSGNNTSFSWNSDNSLKSKTLPGNLEYRYFYIDGNLVEIQNPVDNSIEFEYNNNRKIARKTDYEGNIFQYDYHSELKDKIITYIEPENGVYSLKYNDNGLISQFLNPAGDSVNFSYEPMPGSGQALNSVEFFNGPKYELEYDYFGNISRIVNPAGNAYNFEYYGHNFLSAVIYPDSSSNSVIYDQNGNITTQIFPNQSFTNSFFDGLNRLKTYRDIGSIQSIFDYRGNGEILKITGKDSLKQNFDGTELSRFSIGYKHNFDIEYKGSKVYRISEGNNSKSFIYNEFGEVKHLKANGDTIFSAEFDKNGRITEIETGLTRKSFKLDSLGRIIGIDYPTGIKETFEYDIFGKLVKITDVGTGIYEISRDRFGYPTEILNPYGQKISFEFDTSGNLTLQTDEMQLTKEIAFDNRNRMVFQKDYDGFETNFEFDELGRINKVIYDDRSEKIISRNSFGRINEIIYPGGLKKAFTYSVNGLPKTISDSYGNSSEFEFDELNRLISINTPEYKFDYLFDYNNLLKRAKSNFNLELNFLYPFSGSRIEMTDNTGKTMDIGIMPGNIEITNANSDASVIVTDPLNRIISYRLANGTGYNYSYNPYNKADFKSVNSVKLFETEYFFELPENISYTENRKIEFIHDNKNRIAEVTDNYGRNLMLAYTGNSLVSNINYNGLSRGFEYDQSGRPRRINFNNVEFEINYNDAGKPENIEIDGNRYNFHYDNGRLNRLSYNGTTIFTKAYNDFSEIIKLDNSILKNYIFDMNNFGDLVEITLPGEERIEFFRNLSGESTGFSTPVTELTFELDRAGYITGIEQNGRNFFITNDEKGKPLKIKYSGFDSVEVGYDSYGYRNKISYPNEIIYQFENTPDGFVREIVSPLQNELVITPLQSENSFEFSGAGINKILKSDEFGRINSVSGSGLDYDHTGRLINDNAEGNSFRYSATGILQGVSDRNLYTGSGFKILSETGRFDRIYNYTEGLLSRIAKEDFITEFAYDNFLRPQTVKLDTFQFGLNINFENTLRNLSINGETIFSAYSNPADSVRISGNKIVLDYDIFGNPTRAAFNSLIAEFLFSPNSFPVSENLYSGNELRYTRDLSNQILEVGSDSTRISFYHDEYGKLTDIISGNKRALKSDSSGIIKFVQSENDTLALLEHDTRNSVLSFRGVDIKIITNDSVTSVNSEFGSIEINKSGNKREINFPGYFLRKIYDGKNLSRIEFANPDGKVTAKTDFDYNPLGGQILKKGNKTIKRKFDSRGRIVSITRDFETTYEYDDKSNLTKENSPAGNKFYSYDSFNRILKFDNTSFYHDNYGNLVSKIDETGITEYFYDDLNRLKSMKYPDGSEFVIEYCGENDLFSVSGQGSTTYYLKNGTEKFDFRLVHSEESNLSMLYLFEKGTSSPFAVIDFSQEMVYYPVFDGNGTLHYIIDSGGDTTAIDIDYFGKPQDDVPVDIFFRNYIYLPGLDLYFNNGRYYDNSIKRHLQPASDFYQKSDNLYTPDILDFRAPSPGRFTINTDKFFGKPSFGNLIPELGHEAIADTILGDLIDRQFNGFKYYGVVRKENFAYGYSDYQKIIFNGFDEIGLNGNDLFSFPGLIEFYPKLDEEIYDYHFYNELDDSGYKFPDFSISRESYITFAAQLIELCDYNEITGHADILRKIDTLRHIRPEMPGNTVYVGHPVFNEEIIDKVIDKNHFSRVYRANFENYTPPGPFSEIQDIVDKLELIEPNNDSQNNDLRNVFLKYHENSFYPEIFADSILNDFNEINRINSQNRLNLLKTLISLEPMKSLPGMDNYSSPDIVLPFFRNVFEKGGFLPFEEKYFEPLKLD